MRRASFGWALSASICFAPLIAASGEREEYLLCVNEELGNGTDLSEIGELCLDAVRPNADKSPMEIDEEEEPYPYEKTLRRILVVQGAFFDPESVRFKDLTYSRMKKNHWCGQINAKNKFGGYVGWKYFALRYRYQGYGKEQDHIDLQVSGDVEGTCKLYGAWTREHW